MFNVTLLLAAKYYVYSLGIDPKALPILDNPPKTAASALTLLRSIGAKAYERDGILHLSPAGDMEPEELLQYVQDNARVRLKQGTPVQAANEMGLMAEDIRKARKNGMVRFRDLPLQVAVPTDPKYQEYLERDPGLDNLRYADD